MSVKTFSQVARSLSTLVAPLDARRRRRSETGAAAGTVAGHQVALALALTLTFIAYCGTLAFPFVYDDHVQIAANPAIWSWRLLPQYFTRHAWAFIDTGHFPPNYYRPLFLLWLRLNYLLFGLRPWGWHLTTVLAHVGATLLVYLLVLRLVGERLTGAWAALIFGVHPIHTEAVAWVSGVTEPLVALPLLGSFLCYLRKREGGKPERRWLLLSLALYASAILVKETGLVLTAVVFTYEWCYAKRGMGAEPVPTGVRRLFGAARAAGPYLAVLSFYLVVRRWALHGLIHIVTPLPISAMVSTWPLLLWFYLKKLVWPSDLSLFYDIPYVTRPGFGNFILPIAGLAGTTLLLSAWAKRTANTGAGTLAMRPQAIAFASFWLLWLTLPVLNLRAFPEGKFAQDRFLYLPSVGFAVLAGLALESIPWGRIRFAAVAAARGGVMVAAGVGLAGATMAQSLIWSDDLIVFYRGLKTTPDSPWAAVNLANALRRRRLYPEAVGVLQPTLRRYPDLWVANYELGLIYYRQGNLPLANQFLSRAMVIDPQEPGPYAFLGLTELGLGHLEAAATYIRRAVSLRPDVPDYHFALATVLKLQGDIRGAREEFGKELTVNPDNSDALEQLREIDKGSESRPPSQ